MQYGEIFAITAIVCVVGAVLGLFISGKHEAADDSPTSIPNRRPRPSTPTGRSDQVSSARRRASAT